MGQQAHLIWIDPGGTTGWAAFSVHPHALWRPEFSILSNVTHYASGDWRGPETLQAYEVVKLLRQWPDAAFGIEDFILGMMTQDRSLLSPVRVTAMVEYALSREQGKQRKIFKQGAAEVMGTVTDNRMRQWGFFGDEPRHREHARDARKHCLYFLRRASENTPRGLALRNSAWPHLAARYVGRAA
jgi:hypothetical protein